MRRLKIVVGLVILAAIGLGAYAYLGDLTPDRREMQVPLAIGPDGIEAGRAVAAPEDEAAAGDTASPRAGAAGTDAGAGAGAGDATGGGEPPEGQDSPAAASTGTGNLD